MLKFKTGTVEKYSSTVCIGPLELRNSTHAGFRNADVGSKPAGGHELYIVDGFFSTVPCLNFDISA